MEKKEKTKEERISAEKRRLSKIYSTIEDGKKKIVSGLIERAAFMRIQLEDLEKDLNDNGWTEQFQQSEKCAPYERARPSGQSYLSLAANYQKIVKQLTDIVPDDSSKDAAAELLNFVNKK